MRRLPRPPPAPGWDSDPETSDTPAPWPPIIRVIVILGVVAVIALWFAACASVNLNGLLS